MMQSGTRRSSRKRQATGSRRSGSQRSRSVRRGTKQSLWRGASKPENIYRFVRNVGLTAIQCTSLAPPGGLSFHLNDLPDYAEYTALFDAYKIARVDLTLFPLYINDIVASGISQIQLYSAVDPDDETPVALNNMRQYSNMRITSARHIFKQTIYPKIAAQVYNGVTPAYSQPKGGTFIDCANVDVPHYGWKYCYDAPAASGQWGWRVEARYYLEFKGTR